MKFEYPRLHIFRCRACGWHVWLILDTGRIIPKHTTDSQEEAFTWLDIQIHAEPTG